MVLLHLICTRRTGLFVQIINHLALAHGVDYNISVFLLQLIICFIFADTWLTSKWLVILTIVPC